MFDGAVLVLVLIDIVLQSTHEALGMLRGQHNARLDLRLGHSRHHLDEINYEFGWRMGDDGKVGVNTLSGLLVPFDAELLPLGLVLLVGHFIGLLATGH